MSPRKPGRESRLWTKIGATACSAAALVSLLGCPERSGPTAPEAESRAAEQTSSSDEVNARMPVVLPSRSFRNSGALRTATPSGAPSPTRTPTAPGFTATPFATPSFTPTPFPTKTPTPAGPTVIRLQGQRYQWRWVAGPNGLNTDTVTIKSGQRYTLKVFEADCPDLVLLPHQFSGNAPLGVSGVQLAFGSDCSHYAPDQSQTFTAPPVSHPTVFSFSCMEDLCGNTVQHESMTGSIIVNP